MAAIGSAAIIADPERMDHVDRREGHDDQRGDGDGGDRRRGLHDEEIESDDVPQGRETAEIAVVGLHVAAREHVERGAQDRRAQHQRQLLAANNRRAR